MPMSLSTSDITRIKRINMSKQYLENGEVQTKDLFSNVLPASTRTDMAFVGKLKTVRETSKLIDFKASQVADYVLVTENSGGGRKLTRTKICSPANTCTSILQTKVIPKIHF
jgi:hypothetical protein